MILDPLFIQPADNYNYTISIHGTEYVVDAQLYKLLNDLEADENLFLEYKEDIDSICRKYGIRNYTINDGGSIDVEGDVNLSRRELTKLPLKFRNVSGDFWCFGNQLTTLEGCPQSVEGNFYCFRNKLTTLEGSPESVGGNFLCSNNELTTLRGGPRSVGGGFYCYWNKLTNLEGGPEFVVGDYLAIGNNIVHFRGFPEFYEEGKVDFTGNPVQEILNQFPKDLWISAIYWINEYDVIWDGVVNEERLEEVRGRLGLEI